MTATLTVTTWRAGDIFTRGNFGDCNVVQCQGAAATAVLLATLSHQIKIRECTFRMQTVYNTSVQMIVISDVRNSSTFLLFHVESKHTVV